MKNFKRIFVKKDITFENALKILKSSGQRCLIVVSNTNNLIGTLTDGDIRKAFLKKVNLTDSIKKFYNHKPVKINYSQSKNLKLIQEIFIKYKITVLPVLKKKKIINIINFEDIFDKKINNFLILVMSGGIGSRLKPFTNILPKPLFPINGKAILIQIIEQFYSIGIRKFYVSLFSQANLIKTYLQSFFLKKMDIKYLIEKRKLGTAGAISLISKKELKNKNLILINCDLFFLFNFDHLLDFHLKNKNDLTIVVSKKKFDIPYGCINLDTKKNFLNMEEKPSYMKLVNTGLYILNHKVSNLVPLNKNFNADDLIKKTKKRNLKIGIFKIRDNDWIDVGQWDELKNEFDKIQKS